MEEQTFTVGEVIRFVRQDTGEIREFELKDKSFKYQFSLKKSLRRYFGKVIVVKSFVKNLRNQKVMRVFEITAL